MERGPVEGSPANDFEETASEGKDDQRASAPWKAVVAAEMKAATEANNAWLAENLALSSPTYVSKQAGLARDRKLASTMAVLSISRLG